MEDKITRTNVAAIIFDDEGSVLLCKRSLHKEVAPGRWHIPGGKIETGETFKSAIVRELAEELHLEVTSVVDTCMDCMYEVGNNMHRTMFVYTTTTGSIILNHENDAYLFVDIDKINKFIDESLLSENITAVKIANRIKNGAVIDLCK